MRRALELESPFSHAGPLDDDLLFVIELMMIFGTQVQAWRERRLHLLQQVVVALGPLEEELRKHRVKTSVAVASSRKVAFLAFVTCLLRWPDRGQALCYLKGFHVVGDIAEMGVFRHVGGQCVDNMAEEFYGEPAIQAVSEILESKPPKEHAIIFEQTEAEVAHNLCGDLQTATHFNRKYGVGQWRPLHRFAVHQADGKVRMIDDGRRGTHNDWSNLPETIHTIGVDFPTQVGAALHRRMRSGARG